MYGVYSQQGGSGGSGGKSYRLVTYGTNNQILWSEDGKIWTTASITPATSLPSGIAYSPTLNLFIATTIMGLIKSTDGKTWSHVTGKTVGNYVSVIWNSYIGAFFVTGGNLGIQYSYDGETWSTISGRTTGQYKRLITTFDYNDTLFEYVYTTMPNNSTNIKSNNITTWTSGFTIIGSPRILYNDYIDKYFAIVTGRLRISSDYGETWTNVINQTYRDDFSVHDNIMLAVYAGGAGYKYDYSTDTESALSNINNFRSICYCDIIDKTIGIDSSNIYYSSDDFTNRTLARGISNPLLVRWVKELGLVMVLTTNSGIYYSSDGITYTQSNITSGSGYTNDILTIEV